MLHMFRCVPITYTYFARSYACIVYKFRSIYSPVATVNCSSPCYSTATLTQSLFTNATSWLFGGYSHLVNSHFVNFHFVNSHLVNSRFVNIDQMGIDKMGIDKVGSWSNGNWRSGNWQSGNWQSGKIPSLVWPWIRQQPQIFSTMVTCLLVYSVANFAGLPM